MKWLFIVLAAACAGCAPTGRASAPAATPPREDSLRDEGVCPRRPLRIDTTAPVTSELGRFADGQFVPDPDVLKTVSSPFVIRVVARAHETGDALHARGIGDD